MVDISWSAEARKDLKAIAEYYQISSPEYSRYIVAKLFNSVSKLNSFPQIGRKVPELNLESFRELIVENYRIVYLFEGASIEILTIVHGRRDLFKHLKS